MSLSNTEIVRAQFEAYLSQDRATAEKLLSKDLSFTSPQDDHINKTTFLDVCFPTANRLVSQTIVELVSAGDDGVFLLYEYVLKTGDRYRNAEFMTVRGGQVTEIQVFFGGKV